MEHPREMPVDTNFPDEAGSFAGNEDSDGMLDTARDC
jgi:hypothetical protein